MTGPSILWELSCYNGILCANFKVFFGAYEICHCVLMTSQSKLYHVSTSPIFLKVLCVWVLLKKSPNAILSNSHTVQPSLLNAASFSFHSHFSSPVTFVIQVLLVSGISEPDPDLGSWITSYKFTGLPSSQLRYMYLTNTRMTSKMPKSLPPSAKTVIKFLFSA